MERAVGPRTGSILALNLVRYLMQTLNGRDVLSDEDMATIVRISVEDMADGQQQARNLVRAFWPDIRT